MALLTIIIIALVPSRADFNWSFLSSASPPSAPLKLTSGGPCRGSDRSGPGSGGIAPPRVLDPPPAGARAPARWPRRIASGDGATGSTGPRAGIDVHPGARHH